VPKSRAMVGMASALHFAAEVRKFFIPYVIIKVLQPILYVNRQLVGGLFELVSGLIQLVFGKTTHNISFQIT